MAEIDSGQAAETRSLGEWQALALAAQAITMVLSVAQSMIVVRLLSIEEFGMVGLALGAGGVLDVLQQFTIRSAAVKELARDRDERHAQAVVLVAMALRMLMVLPNAIIVFSAAGRLANGAYGQPELQFPIQLMALTMLLAGARSILENTLTGLQAFRTYYLYLICAFVLRLILFTVLVAGFKVNGYFYAELAWGLVLTVGLLFLVPPRLGSWQGLPSWERVKPIALTMLGLSLVLFLARLSYVWWRRGATALLGLMVSNVDVGLFHFGLGFAGQMLAFSGTLGTIYMPVMSRLASKDRRSFDQTLSANLTQVTVLFLYGAGALILFAREVVWVMAGRDYLLALPMIPALGMAFFLEALFGMLSNSALIPTGNDRWYLWSVLVGRGLSLALFVGGLAWRGLWLGAWGLFIGLLPGMVLMLWSIRSRLGIRLFRPDLLPLLVLVALWVGAALQDWALWWRIGLLVAISPVYVWWSIKRGMIDLQALRDAASQLLVRVRRGSEAST